MKAFKKPAVWLEKRSNSVGSTLSNEAHHAAQGIASTLGKLKIGSDKETAAGDAALSTTRTNQTLENTSMQVKSRGRLCRRRTQSAKNVSPALDTPRSNSSNTESPLTPSSGDWLSINDSNHPDDDVGHASEVISTGVMTSLADLLAAASDSRSSDKDNARRWTTGSAVSTESPSLAHSDGTSSDDDSHTEYYDRHTPEDTGPNDHPAATSESGQEPKSELIRRPASFIRNVSFLDQDQLDAMDHLQEVDAMPQEHAIERAVDQGSSDAVVQTEAPSEDAYCPHLAQLNSSNTLAFFEDKAGSWSGEGREEMLGTVPAMLIRNVLIKGILSLTNKRLLFYAFIATQEDQDSDAVLVEGPITMHYSERWKPKRKVYCAITSTGVAHYHSATDRYKPIGARSFSAFDSVAMVPDDPCRFVCTMITGAYREIEFDTPEESRKWLNILHNALFRYRNKADHIIVAVPWSRVENITYDTLLDFCKIVQMKVNCGTRNEASSDSEHKDIVLGIHRKAYDILPSIEKQFASQPTMQQHDITAQPACYIGIDNGAQRTEDNEQMEEDDTADLGPDFVREFGLEEDPHDLYVVKADVIRSLPDYGHLAVSDSYICFWRKSKISEDSRIKIPISDVEDARHSKVFRMRVWGLSLRIRASPDQRFEFSTPQARDDTLANINQRIKRSHELRLSRVASPQSRETTSAVVSSPSAQSDERSNSLFSDSTSKTSSISSAPLTSSPEASPSLTKLTGQQIHQMLSSMPVTVPAAIASRYPAVVNLPPSIRRATPRHFVLMTIGSRGDVQPYIALGKRLSSDGHRVTIASHEEYRKWVTSHGLEYRAIGGDATALMQLSVEHKMFSPGFFVETLGKFRHWFDRLLLECWEVSHDADVIIESPSTFAGIHVAEARAVPYFRAFTMPWTSTSQYPQAFAPTLDAGPAYNLMSYTLFDKVLWQASSSQINKWRKNTLLLKPTSLEKLDTHQVPFIYNFSPAVVPRPLDWASYIHVSGYWFLDEADKDWRPDSALLKFIAGAKESDVPLVYIGFGSITITNVEKVIKHIYKAVQEAGVRAIVSKGWSSRGQDGAERKVHLDAAPEQVFLVDSIPHDWLFPQISAAVHHGGAGTTGASLRAGIPTIIHPFFGDQNFWSTRVQRLGAGVRLPNLSVSEISKALTYATTDRIMREKAQQIGEQIRSEDGCGKALDFIYQLLYTTEKRAHERHRRASLLSPLSPTRTTDALSAETAAHDEIARLSSEFDKLSSI